MSEQSITGLAEVRANMRKLADKRKQKNAATRSARKAMNIVKKDAVAIAKTLDNPDSPNRIWKNIQTKASRIKSQDRLVMRVGVRGGAKQYAKTKANLRKGLSGKTYKTGGSKANPGGDTWYWRFLEFGTSRQAAKPFMRMAFYNNQDSAKQEFINRYKDELQKELNK